MARNKFLKRMAVTALAASMTFGTVPAVAMNVFADTKVTTQVPGDADEATKTLYADFEKAVSGLTVSRKSTGNDIASAIKTALTPAGSKDTYDVSVTIDSTEAAKYDGENGVILPVINARATIKKYEKATEVEQEHATDAVAVLENYEFSVDCKTPTDEDQVAVAMGYFKAKLDSEYAEKNGYTFTDEKSVSATPITKKLESLRDNAPDAVKSYIDSANITFGNITTNIESHSTPDMEGYVGITVPVTHNTKEDKDKKIPASSYSGTFDAKVRILRTNDVSTLADAQKVIDNAELTNEEAVSGYIYSKDSQKITDKNFVDITSILNDKLSVAGIKGIKVSSVTIANDSSNKTATHAANGSVKVSVTYDDKDKTTSIQTLTIVHSEADIEAEAVAEVKSALGKLTAADFQANKATAAPSEAEVKKVITDAVDKALANKLGGTVTIASELYGEKPYEFAASPEFKYEPATALASGSVTAAIQLNKAHEASSKVDTVKYEALKDDKDNVITIGIGTSNSGTVTLDKLVRKDATAFSLGSDVVAKGAVTITPTLSPDNANTAYVKLDWKGNSKLDKAYVKITHANNTTEVIKVTNNGTSVSASDSTKNIIPVYAGDTITVVNGTDKSGYDSDNDETWKDVQGTLTATLYDARDNKLGTDSINVKLTELFTDVTDSTQYYFAPVYKLTNKKIIAGTTASTYSPAQNVKRGDFITLLYRTAQALDKDAETVKLKDSYSSDKFSDVSSDAYYAKAVAWAVNEKIAYGTSATTFNPNKTVTRAEAVAFLARFSNWYYGTKVDVTKGDTFASTKFTDVNPEDYFAEAVTWAYNKGITYGNTPTTFAPSTKVTRAQAAAFISRLLDITGTNKDTIKK